MKKIIIAMAIVAIVAIFAPTTHAAGSKIKNGKCVVNEDGTCTNPGKDKVSGKTKEILVYENGKTKK